MNEVSNVELVKDEAEFILCVMNRYAAMYPLDEEWQKCFDSVEEKLSVIVQEEEEIEEEYENEYEGAGEGYYLVLH